MVKSMSQDGQSKIPTEFLKYPCPTCGQYFLPYMHSKDGYAFMICPQHGQFKTSVAVSANFRKFCSKLGSAPNRSPGYYTSSELRVKRYLDNLGLIEGMDYFHNSRIPAVMDNKKRFFFPDFTLPKLKLCIGASPHIWHKMWGRNNADKRFTAYMKKLGWKVINLDEKDLNQLNKRRTEGKKLGRNPNVKPYHRTATCKRLDKILKEKKNVILTSENVRNSTTQ